MIYRFENFELDLELFELRCAGETVKIERRIFDLLTCVVENCHRVVTKEELFDKVWADLNVSEATLNSSMMATRRAVGDDGRNQRLIKTIYGRGYHFVGAVSQIPDTRANDNVDDETPVEVLPHRRLPVTETPLPSGARQPVTLLYITIVGTSMMRKQIGLDALHTAMNHLRLAVRDEVSRYEGTLQPVAGDRITVVFGAPRAQEDHALRAALTAIGLQQRLREEGDSHELSLPICMALHTELMIVVEAEDGDVDAAPMVVGDTTTLTTLLQQHAEPGVILCSESTYHMVRGEVRAEALEPLSTPGIATTVAAYQIRGIPPPRKPGAPRRMGRQNPFVGRESELDTLMQLLDQVDRPQGRLVGIVGDPGVGKSRLLQEFRQRLAERQITYLTGRCLSYQQATPYLAVIDLMRDNFGLSESDSPADVTTKIHHGLEEVGLVPEAHAGYLLRLLGVPLEAEQLTHMTPEAIKFRTFDTLIQLCVLGSRKQPLVVEVEDLHWLDPTSAACLNRLADSMAGAAILLLGTYRPGYRPAWLDKSYATQIFLSQLEEAESRVIVHHLIPPTELADGLVKQIVSKAEGNPFFLEELTQTFMDDPHANGSFDMPDTVQAVLAARIDRLAPTEKQLLQAAAVIGREVPLALLSALTQQSEDELVVPIGNLQAAEFLYRTPLSVEPIYFFKHMLTQEMAYQSVLKDHRQRYHQDLAGALATQFEDMVKIAPELLAHHYTEAGLTIEAIERWYQAGQLALENSAYIEATGHLKRGLELLATLPETAERTQKELGMQLTLGRASMAVKGYAAPEVGDAYARAREICAQMGDTPRLFSVYRGLAAYYSMRANYPVAEALGQQCLSICEGAETPNPGQLLRAHLTLGQILLFRGHYIGALDHFDRGRAQVASQSHRSRAIRAVVQDSEVTCHALTASTLWLLGRPEEATGRGQNAIDLARTLGHPFSLAEALVFTAVVDLSCRDYAKVREHTEEALEIATEQGFPHWEAHAAIYQGWARTMEGDGETGIAQMRAGQAIWQQIGCELARPWFLALLAEAYGHIGNDRTGMRLLDEAFGVVANSHEGHYESELYRLRGELLQQSSLRMNAEQAADHFQRALDIARGQEAKSLELRAAMSLSQLLQKQGEHDAAHQALAPCYEQFTEGFDTGDLQAARTLLSELATKVSPGL